jgi:hypothetical protein
MNSALVFSAVSLGLLAGMNLVEYDVSYVKSNIDGNNHLVRNAEYRQEAADLIANIKLRFNKLINFLYKRFSTHPIFGKAVWRLKKKFNSDNIQESAPHSKYTSFSVNKGEELHFCIRPKNKELSKKIRFHKINTLMFVGIHELAHIMSVSYGHNREFHRNFVFLLKQSVNVGIYKKQNYRKHSEKFCGIEINNTPLPDSYFNEE